MYKSASPFLEIVNFAMAATPILAVIAYVLLPVVR